MSKEESIKTLYHEMMYKNSVFTLKVSIDKGFLLTVRVTQVKNFVDKCHNFEYCENYHKISLTASGDKRPWLRRGRWSGTSPLELIVIVDELLEIIAAESRDSPDHDTTSSSSSAATRPAGWWSLNLPDSLDRPLNILLELARWNLIPHQLLL